MAPEQPSTQATTPRQVIADLQRQAGLDPEKFKMSDKQAERLFDDLSEFAERRKKEVGIGPNVAEDDPKLSIVRNEALAMVAERSFEITGKSKSMRILRSTGLSPEESTEGLRPGDVGASIRTAGRVEEVAGRDVGSKLNKHILGTYVELTRAGYNASDKIEFVKDTLDTSARHIAFGWSEEIRETAQQEKRDQDQKAGIHSTDKPQKAEVPKKHEHTGRDRPEVKKPSLFKRFTYAVKENLRDAAHSVGYYAGRVAGAVLPEGSRVSSVEGVQSSNMREWLADGFSAGFERSNPEVDRQNWGAPLVTKGERKFEAGSHRNALDDVMKAEQPEQGRPTLMGLHRQYKVKGQGVELTDKGREIRDQAKELGLKVMNPSEQQGVAQGGGQSRDTSRTR